ncbi:hypothetical protein MPSEU_000364000 [Mayamaea pseudoterrestris]|nr:hypothetical protein MPSEU_000364000 [Mayamaea pseudoterrestris]
MITCLHFQTAFTGKASSIVQLQVGRMQRLCRLLHDSIALLEAITCNTTGFGMRQQSKQKVKSFTRETTRKQWPREVRVTCTEYQQHFSKCGCTGTGIAGHLRNRLALGMSYPDTRHDCGLLRAMAMLSLAMRISCAANNFKSDSKSFSRRTSMMLWVWR